jgi:uncharacterized protein (TIGR02145 family)
MSATDDTAVLSAFTISGETDITAYIQSKNATEAVVEAIIAPHTIPIGKTIDFTIGGETKTYTFDTALTLDPGKVYDFVFTLKASGQQVPPSDSEDGMTNSYIVIPGKLLTFEVKRAYNSSNRVFAETLRAGNVDTYPHTFTTEVLWDDNGVISGTPTVSGTGHIAEVTVQTTNNHGNAVVAIKVGSDIVWSYHIWVTDYDPQVAANTFTANSGYVFMNRNLGARERDLTYGVNTFGLLYQWGRKDPFPGSMQGAAGWPASGGIDSKFVGLGTRTTVGDATNAAAIVTSIKNPQTFYSYKNTDYYNWLPTKDNTLWNTAGTNQKTVYDPCPSGWRVPRFLDNTYDEAHSPWKDYASPSGTDTWGKWDKGTPTGGMKFGPDTNPNSDDAQYPAPGYLHYANGAAARGYETGLYWASNQYKETSFYAAALYLRYTGQVDVHYYGGYRAHGFSVRCVRE